MLLYSTKHSLFSSGENKNIQSCANKTKYWKIEKEAHIRNKKEKNKPSFADLAAASFLFSLKQTVVCVPDPNRSKQLSSSRGNG